MDISEVHEKKNDDLQSGTISNANHSLGLQDLYKAAFCQEFEEKSETPTQDFEVKVQTKGSDGFHMHTLKQLSYIEHGSESYQSAAPVLSYEVFGNDTNSVLDLDKGIQVQVVKGSSYELQTYSCDPQILQRYLHDTMVKSDSADASNLSSDSIVYLTKPTLYDESDGTGILPEKLGVKYEDCDFNSSDSFASTESIIPKSIQCPKCPKKFMFKSDLTRHTKYKHGCKPKLTCAVCGKDFPSQQNLLFHEKSHKKNGSVCEVCKKSFKKSVFLVKHMMQKHSQFLPFACPECPLAFPTAPMYLTHCKKEHDPPIKKPFRCQKCGKGFDRRQGLSCHEKSHYDEPHLCETCGKIFTRSSYLKTHMRMHADPSLIICEVCGQDFKTAENLSEHAKVHSGEKPFQCQQCPKTFSYMANYEVHLRIHSDVKPHLCDHCPKAFAAQSDLKKHAKIHFLRFKCAECLQEFTTKSALTLHMRKMHSKVSTQETFTQTGEDLITLQNVSFVTDPNISTVQNSQSIVLTPLAGFGGLPFIITQPESNNVPFTISS